LYCQYGKVGSEVAGLFGLIGVAGAAAASVVGKMADQRDPRFANGISMGMTLFSFVLMWLIGQWLIGLIIGVILLDLGAQANHISNQARIYKLEAGDTQSIEYCLHGDVFRWWFSWLLFGHTGLEPGRMEWSLCSRLLPDGSCPCLLRFLRQPEKNKAQEESTSVKLEYSTCQQRARQNT
jgi:hypothetical protein